MRGRAFGARGTVTNPNLATVKIGEVAVQSLLCNPALGTTRTNSEENFNAEINTVAMIDVPLPVSGNPVLAKSSTLTQSGYATAETDRSDAYERSVVQEFRLLVDTANPNGRIWGKVVQADAHTTLDSGGFNHHTTVDVYSDAPGNVDGSTGTTLLEVYVDPDGAGGLAPIHIAEKPQPNTTITLSNLGKVVFNEQMQAGTLVKHDGVWKRSGIDVNGIHVYLFDDPATPTTESFFGYTGDLILAHAETRIQPAFGRLSGFAYASRGTVDPVLESGQQAIVHLPCQGTLNKKTGIVEERVLTQEELIIGGLTATYPTLLHQGTMRSSVKGDINQTGAFSESSERIETVRLLTRDNGVAVVAADVLTSGTKVQSEPGGLRMQGASDLVNLRVDTNLDGDYDDLGDVRLDGGVPPNTRIELGGLGYIRLNEQNCKVSATDSDASDDMATCTDASKNPSTTNYASITVYGIHLKVTVADNLAGLPVGAEVFVSVAHSDVAY